MTANTETWIALGSEPKDGTYFLIAGEWVGPEYPKGYWTVAIAHYDATGTLYIGSYKTAREITWNQFKYWAPIPAVPEGGIHQVPPVLPVPPK